MEKTPTTRTLFCLYLIFSYFTFISCAPKPLVDDGEPPNGNEIIPNLINQTLDYNAMMGHFKDFFMFLPVMFTTLKESMSGFPKFAEGVRILTTGNNAADEDCKCKPKSFQKSNDIE